MNEAAPEKTVERLEVDLAGRAPEAAGVDGVRPVELRAYLRPHWSQTKTSLLGGTYQPLPVRRVDISTPGGGTRMLGIPTVLDRLIQQAIHQGLSPVWEGSFSESRYGFRPGRGTRQAVKAARHHVHSGKRWEGDMDLEKFFARANHDVLLARVARKVTDKRLPGLIRRYLQSGALVGGLMEARAEGPPQGGPRSPLLANILLDDLDKELEARGHAFCRYAEDCNIDVRPKRAGEGG